MTRLAVVLFNLGGPDSPEAVRPFLRNLFDDPAIIGAPGPIRHALAWWIAKRRAPFAREIYAKIGGRSPLLELTREQGIALETALGNETKVFVAMRYWHPFTDQAVAEVMAWAPERILLLPLYPQYSTTTSGSSLAEWTRQAEAAGLDVPTTSICCYPSEEGMIKAQAETLLAGLSAAGEGARVLLSAHGLPKRVIDKGDPYQGQVERTAKAIVKATKLKGLDWRVTYQSRVGPMEWIGPATDAEIRRAGAEGKALVIQPIAFVSEHSETLVELDIEYAHLAKQSGVPVYVRVPALGTHPLFIKALAELANRALISGCNPCSEIGGRICPEDRSRCAHGALA